MRDPKRIKQILAELEEYWTANPDLRLCQIITNVAWSIDDAADIFYVEDNEMLTAFIDQNKYNPSIIKGSTPVVDMEQPAFKHNILPNLDMDDGDDCYICVKCEQVHGEIKDFTPYCSNIKGK